MKIKMTVKMINTGNIFDEEYDIENTNIPQEYVNQLISNFNRTLRPMESPRELVNVEIIENESEVIYKHAFVKQNLYTISSNNGTYDIVKCERCGVTGKRYGLTNIKRDAKYKAKIYDTCNGAIKQIEKLKALKK